MSLETVSSSAAAANTLTVGVQRHRLDNGLTVLTKGIHTAPVVSVQVWYKVGARNETANLNGISHQLEHLMFKGTQSRPVQFGRLFSALGSASNAFTSYDMTAYYGTVSRNKLDALLTLEADRMVNTVINDTTLTAEKRVVISELQGYENSPSYRLTRMVMKQALGDHPYARPVGGVKTDVEAFTLQQVQAYYQQYYQPNNAVLVITGDIDQDQVLEQVQHTFGAIASPSPAPDTRPISFNPPQTSRSPVTVEEPGSVILLERIYPLVSNLHPDMPAVDIMDAILSAGHNSRLHQDLVESGMVSHVGAYGATLMDGGWYDLSLTAPPNTDLAPIEAQLDKTLASLYEHPISPAELNRARQQLTTQFIFGSRDIDAQATQLAYNELSAGDYQFSDRYLTALESVTAEDVQQVAKDYLTPERYTQGLFIPTKLSPVPLVMGATQTQEDFGTNEPVDPAEVAEYLPQLTQDDIIASQVNPERFELPNGLRVLLLADHSSPTLTLSGHLTAGNAYDVPGKGGVANLTAEMLLCGTQRHNELELTDRLESNGIHLDVQSFREGLDIEGHALSKDLSLLLETLAEIMQEATFPAEKLEIARQRSLMQLQMEMDDPQRLGRRKFQQTLFPASHPFHVFPTLESLTAITREDLVHHYEHTYRPEKMVLVLVGDLDVAMTRSQMEDLFGQWSAAGLSPALTYPDLQLPTESQTLEIPLAGKSQVITYMGHVSFRRRDPRYYAALILNEILGGDTLSSRLGNEIRDHLGLTYGIYSYFSAGFETGSFVIEMQTSPEDTQKAIQSTLSLVRQLIREGVTETEFKTVQRSLLNAYPVEFSSPDNVAHRLLLHEVDGLPLDEIKRVPERIAAVTLEQIHTIAPELIHPDHMVIVNAGPVS